MHEEAEHVTDTACDYADSRSEQHTYRCQRYECEIDLAEWQIDGERLDDHAERDEHGADHEIDDGHALLLAEQFLRGKLKQIKKAFHSDLLKMTRIIKRMKDFIFTYNALSGMQ